MDVDDVFSMIGEAGLWQKKSACVIYLFQMAVSMQMVQLVIVGAQPKIFCHVKGGAATAVEGCGKHCTYTYGDSFTSIVTEWDLVCKDSWKVGAVQSFFMLGVMIGAVICGHLSDKYGRKKIYLPVIAAWHTLCILSTFATTLQVFTVIRFLFGIAQGAAGLIMCILLSEILGASKRGVYLMVLQLTFAVGICTFAAIGYFVRDWQHLSLLTSVSFLPIGLGSYWYTVESPRWLYSKGRISEAEEVLRYIARGNGKQAESSRIRLKPIEYKQEKEGQKSSHSIMTLLKEPKLRTGTLIQIYSWFVNSAVYYGLTMGAGSLGANLYVSIALSGAVEIPGYGLMYILQDRLGRVLTIVSFMVVGGLSCIAILLTPVHATNVNTVLALIGKTSIAGSFAVIYLHSAEYHATEIRNTAMAILVMAARIGGIVAPMIIPLGDIYPSLQFFIFGMAAFTAGVGNYGLEETLNKPMPETIGDMLGPTHQDRKISDDKVKLLSELEEQDI